jgi:hypothetical protein
MINSSKPHGKQVTFSGGPHFKISISRVGGFYVLSATEFDAGEVKFEIIDSSGHSFPVAKRISTDGSISITWGAKLDAGAYKLAVTANKDGKQITDTQPFDVK